LPMPLDYVHKASCLRLKSANIGELSNAEGRKVRLADGWITLLFRASAQAARPG
jgi:hypothetical protein